MLPIVFDTSRRVSYDHRVWTVSKESPMRILSSIASATMTLALVAGCGSSTVAPPDEEGAGGDTGAGGSAQTGGAGGAAGATKTDGGKAGAAGKAGGGTGAGGTTGSGGSSGGSGAITVPVPAPGTADKPAPSGSAANLKVLPWAGFKAAVSYSFDDTQPSQIEHYAELQATGVHMTFYANTNATWETDYDKTWTQAVKDGHEMGNHTVNHCNADGTYSGGVCKGYLGTPDAEIDECTNYIVQTFGQKGVWTMASPFGDGGWKPYAQAKMLMMRGTGGGSIAPTDNVDWYALPTFAAGGGESVAALSAPIDAARAAGKWQIYMFHSINPTSSAWYATVDIASITGSLDHGKQLGDVWLDSVINVGAYLSAQQMLAKVTPTGTTDKTYAWTLPAHFPPGHGVRVTVDGGTLKQGGTALTWDAHGYYEVALDAGSLTWSP
jgi:hypothetical protein